MSSFKLVIKLLSWTRISCRCVQGVETMPSVWGPWEGTLWGLMHNDFLSPRALMCCVPPPLQELLPRVSWVFIVVFQPLLLTYPKNAVHFLLVVQTKASLTWAGIVQHLPILHACWLQRALRITCIFKQRNSAHGQ